MGAKLSNEKFQQDIKEMTNGTFTFLEPYQGAWTKLWCKHNVCGYIFKISPANFKRTKNRCPYCLNNGYLYRMDNHGHIDRLISVRCPKMHRFKIFEHQIPDFLLGKIKCPICQRLKRLDPLYIHAHVEFDFEFKDGHLL